MAETQAKIRKWSSDEKIICRYLKTYLGRKIVGKSLREVNLLVAVTRTLKLMIFSGRKDAMIEFDNSYIVDNIGNTERPTGGSNLSDYNNLFIYFYI